LWRAAARLLATRPLLGIGLDNFRLLYGRYAGLPGADPRVHTNNMYFELLVGGGLVGALAFGWLLWRARAMFAAALRADAPRPAIAIGLVAAGVAILLHGLVDCFLSFTPTYVLFGLTAGLAGACARGTEHADANRV
jgi:O-antigen ligase